MDNLQQDKNYIEIVDRIKEAFSAPEVVEMLVGAVEFAFSAHEGQKRSSGEDYIIHPIQVAIILMDIGLDPETIIAALIHDVVEDTQYTSQDIEQKFGKEVCDLVIGVTKLEKIDFKSQEEEQAENFRKMFFAMAKDIRVLMIKLADRLHNMRTLSFLPKARQVKMAQETLDIYTPLAGKLGISQIKCELEDLCLRYLDTEKYYTLVELINTRLYERKRLVGLVVEEISEDLKSSEIEAEVFGRPKHLYSIYKKMRDKHLAFEQIYDMIAVRIIVKDIDNCYEVLGKIHKKWKPIPGRIKDYIATPKPNLYQSLHTTVVTNYGQPFEIQIRTYEMHKTAEYGIAAHWKYKEKRDATTTFDERLSFLREIMEWEGDLKDSVDFLTSFKGDLYTGEVLVFTPKGDVKSLAEGSTPIDFAYHIHSAVGNKCTGAIVNGKIVPLSYQLQVGDVVEIITNNGSKGPSWDWLKIAKTNGAKGKIRQFFKKEMKEENIKRGKSMLEIEAKRRGFSLSQLTGEKHLAVLFSKLAFTSIDEMYASVGYGAVTVNQIIVKLVDSLLAEIEKEKPKEFLNVASKPSNSKNNVLIAGNAGMQVRISGCCSPVPGDAIVGFISRGRGVIVHRCDCPNLKGLEEDRLIEASWVSTLSQSFSVAIQVVAVDSNNILAEIVSAISNMQIPINSVNARIDKNKNAIMNFTITLKNIDDLAKLFTRLNMMEKVIKVFRSNNQ
ncbi:MAG: bifunctional (p)ppGpp synthetase/guanosine-3',5'-bis(diphosphate) 3'-pyrophosphohydrolase [Bacillota bacterium]